MYLVDFVTKALKQKAARIQKYDRQIRREKEEVIRNELIDRRAVLSAKTKEEHDKLKKGVYNLVKRKIAEKSADKR